MASTTQNAYEWFKRNQKSIIQTYGKDSYVVCNDESVLFSSLNSRECAEYVFTLNEQRRSEVIIDYASNKSLEKILLAQHKMVRGTGNLGITEDQKQMFAWLKAHQDDLVEKFGKDCFIVYDHSGILYHHRELSLCRQWVLEHRSYKDVVIRKTYLEPYQNTDKWIKLPDGQVMSFARDPYKM